MQLKLNYKYKKSFQICSLKDIKKINPIYNVLELFSGAGGMALGLHRAGFNPVALVDIDKDANSTILKNFPDWNVDN